MQLLKRGRCQDFRATQVTKRELIDAQDKSSEPDAVQQFQKMQAAYEKAREQARDHCYSVGALPRQTGVQCTQHLRQAVVRVALAVTPSEDTSWRQCPRSNIR